MQTHIYIQLDLGHQRPSNNDAPQLIFYTAYLHQLNNKIYSGHQHNHRQPSYGFVEDQINYAHGKGLRLLASLYTVCCIT